MRIALALERYHTAAHGDVDRTPMMRWSDSSPLVNDLMAAGIRLCSYMIGVDPETRKVTDPHRSPTKHAPCMLRLALANILRRQSDRPESFVCTWRNAAKRYSASATICGTRAVQRSQRRTDGEGRECSSP